MKRPPTIVVQLVHILGPLKGEIQEFVGPVVSIGRHPDCHLRFPADLTVISRKHAEIIREGNQFRLVDHSANGTFVNGKATKEAILKDGDVIEFATGGPKVSFLTQMKEESITPPVIEEPKPLKKEPAVRLPEVRKPETPRSPVSTKPERVQPKAESPEEEIPVQPVKVSLVIQYGPTLRSFKQLPVIIGKNPKCEFKLDHPAILEQHVQIFFSQGQYCVKDLTGQQAVRINGHPIALQSPLKPDDEVALSPRGPVFRFLGEGRLAEVANPTPQEPASPSVGRKIITPRREPEPKAPEGLISKVKKLFES